MTSAPKTPRNVAARGPANSVEMSRTRTPARGAVIGAPLLVLRKLSYAHIPGHPESNVCGTLYSQTREKILCCEGGILHTTIEVPVGALSTIVAASLEHDKPGDTVAVFAFCQVPHRGCTASETGKVGSKLPFILGGESGTDPCRVGARVTE